MTGNTDNMNIVELLMGIKEDVASIKSDIVNLKETHKNERESISREIADVRTDCQHDLAALESRVMGRINSLQSVQSTLVGDVDTLKQAEDKKDAKRYRTTVAFVLTALGGMFASRLPEIIKFLIGLIGGK